MATHHPPSSPFRDRSVSHRLRQDAEGLQPASSARYSSKESRIDGSEESSNLRHLPDRNDLINDRCHKVTNREHQGRYDGEEGGHATLEASPVQWEASAATGKGRHCIDQDDDDCEDDEGIKCGSAGMINRTTRHCRAATTTKTMYEGSRRDAARTSSAEPARETESHPLRYSMSSPASLAAETESSSRQWNGCKRKRHLDDADDAQSSRTFGREEDERAGEGAEIEEDELQSDNDLFIQDVSTSSIASANSFFSPMARRTPLGKEPSAHKARFADASVFDHSTTLGSATSMEEESSPDSAKRTQDGIRVTDKYRGRDGTRPGYDADRPSYEIQDARAARPNGDGRKAVDRDRNATDADLGHQSIRTSSSSPPVSANERSSRTQYTVTMLAGAPQRKSCDRCFRMKTKCSRAAPGASNDKPCEGCIRRGFGHDCVTSRPDFPQPRITLAKRPRRDIQGESVVAMQAQNALHHSVRTMDMHARNSDAGNHSLFHGRRDDHRRTLSMAATDAAGHASLASLQHSDPLAGPRSAATPPVQETRYTTSDAVRQFRPTFAPIQHHPSRRPDSTAYDLATHGSVPVTSRYEGAGVAWSGEHKSKAGAASAGVEAPSSLLVAMRANHHAESVCQALHSSAPRVGYGLPPRPANRLHSMRTDELRDALIVIAEELAKRAAPTTASATGLGLKDAPPASAASSSATSPPAFQPSPHMHRGQ